MVNVNNSSTAFQIQTAPAPHRTLGSVIYGLLGLVMIVALFGLGMAHGLRAYFESEEARRADTGLAAIHAIAIGAQQYLMPAILLTDPAQRREGFAERVDLTLALPLAADGQLSEIDLAIVPRGRVRTSAALLDSVYLHQFSGVQLSGPPGLVGKPLEKDAGTAGETVWYDPLNANPFTAKCMTPVDMSPGARTCLRVMTLSDRNTAIVSFDPAILANWRAFDTRIEEAVAALRK